jgi:hypothetical protein
MTAAEEEKVENESKRDNDKKEKKERKKARERIEKSIGGGRGIVLIIGGGKEAIVGTIRGGNG